MQVGTEVVSAGVDAAFWELDLLKVETIELWLSPVDWRLPPVDIPEPVAVAPGGPTVVPPGAAIPAVPSGW